MQTVLNRVTLRGRVETCPVLSHSSHGVTYFCFSLAVKRLSGVEDVIPILVSETILFGHPCQKGQPLTVEGSLRSFNNRSGIGSRLVITVQAKELSEGYEPDDNQVRLSGVLCKLPVYRKTPLGREICDLILAVNRSYGRADYLPCIAWSAEARRCASCGIGDRLILEGRIQSRGYIKNMDGLQVQKTAFEVSVSQVLEEESAGANQKG